jgi:hypothetical protein
MTDSWEGKTDVTGEKPDTLCTTNTTQPTLGLMLGHRSKKPVTISLIYGSLIMSIISNWHPYSILTVITYLKAKGGGGEESYQAVQAHRV